jgi:hypothetical protein
MRLKKYVAILLLIIAISGFSMSSVSAAHVGSDTTCGIHFDVYDNSQRAEARELHIEFPPLTFTYHCKSNGWDYTRDAGWKYLWYSPKKNLYFDGSESDSWSENRAVINKALDDHEEPDVSSLWKKYEFGDNHTHTVQGSVKAKMYLNMVSWHETCWTPEFILHRGDNVKIETDSVPGGWFKFGKADLKVFVNDKEVAHVKS